MSPHSAVADGTPAAPATGNRMPAIPRSGASRSQARQLRTTETPSRVRTLICNWSTHFCGESLITVPSGPWVVGPPYKLVVSYDLEKRRGDLRAKNAHLVAFDADRLRSFGSGMGIDPLEASNSFLARDCLCSDVVPLRSLWGTAEIEFFPPDVSQGDALILLRVVKSANLRNMQDWHPIGDAVVVRAEPKKRREDEGYIQRLYEELQVSRAIAKSTHEALECSQDECRASLAAGAEMRAELAQWQHEMEESREDARQLHAELGAVSTDMEAASDSRAELNAALSLRGVLGKSRQRQLLTSQRVVAATERAMEESRSDAEMENAAMMETRMALSRMRQEEAAILEARSEERTAMMMRSALDKKHSSQLRTSRQSASDLQAALERAQQEVAASQASASQTQNQLDNAQLEVAEYRKKHAEVRAELEAKKRSAEHALMKFSLAGGVGAPVSPLVDAASCSGAREDSAVHTSASSDATTANATRALMEYSLRHQH